MLNSLKKFRVEFLKSKDNIADITQYGDIPEELIGEDVYNYFLLFKNEFIILDYLINKYDLKRNDIWAELHE